MARRRKIIQPKFYVFLCATLCVIGGIIAIVASSSHAGELRYGTMTATIEAKAVCIRDEMNIEVARYDHAEHLVDEGATVYSGQSIANVYKWGYTADMAQQLMNVESDIYNAQTALLSGIENADLASYDLQIEQKRIAIRSAIMDDSGADTLTLQRELEELLAARNTFLRSTVQPTETLTALYQTEEEKTASLNTYRSTVASAGDGIISFYFDGYEQILNSDKLSTLNASIVKSIISENGNMLGGSSSDLIYRLVDPSHWYVAFTEADSELVRLAPGETYAITFKGYEDMPVTGVALDTNEADGNILNIAEITSDVTPYIRSRKLDATFTSDMEGFILPKKYVGVESGVAYITLDRGSENERVPVEVLAVNDADEALVRALDADAEIDEGMRYVKP